MGELCNWALHVVAKYVSIVMIYLQYSHSMIRKLKGNLMCVSVPVISNAINLSFSAKYGIRKGIVLFIHLWLLADVGVWPKPCLSVNITAAVITEFFCFVFEDKGDCLPLQWFTNSVNKLRVENVLKSCVYFIFSAIVVGEFEF